MNISESLKSAVQNLRRELKKVNYPLEVDYAKLALGEPESYLPILHHAFVDFSLPLAKHLAENCKTHLAGKSDSAFITALYSVLRDDFGYRPPITADQFFKRAAFAEKKTVMCIDLLQLVRERHKTLTEMTKLASSTSKLADMSLRVNSNPPSARSTNSVTSNSSNKVPSIASSVSTRRSFYVAPSAMKKEALGVSTASGPLNRINSQSSEELKASIKSKRDTTEKRPVGAVSKENDSQTNVSVSSGVRIVVEKHGVNVASRRSIAASSGEFKAPLKTAPRTAANANKHSQPEAEVSESRAEDQSEEEYLSKRDRRKTMFGGLTSLQTKLERTRHGTNRLTAIVERKSMEAGEAQLADKENDCTEPKAIGRDGDSIRTEPFKIQENSYAKASDGGKLRPTSGVDVTKSKGKRAANDVKHLDQKPVVVTTIDKTLLETILARLELAESRLHFAERNIQALLENANLPQATAVSSAKNVLIQNHANGDIVFDKAASSDVRVEPPTSIMSDVNAQVMDRTIEAKDCGTYDIPNDDADGLSNVREDADGKLQPLNDTDVPFNGEVVVGDGIANSTWHRELETDGVL